MTWRVGRAFRTRKGFAYGAPAAEDVLRVRGTSSRPFVALANAYDDGFATNWPAGSRLLLDALEDPRPGSGGVREAFERAAEAFVRDAAMLDRQFDEDWPPMEPNAALLLACVDGPTTHVAWLGGALAVQWRDREPVAWTTPHTVLAEWAERLPNHAAGLRGVLTRRIRGATTSPELVSFALRPGDRMLFVAGSGFEADVSALARAARARTPEKAAARAVKAGAGDEVFMAAACVELR
ncbi:MAG: hypothetical protein AAGH15_12945 [Myxococcota bacterium]